MADRQHLVFALGQVAALGLDPSSVRRWAREGRLHRVHQAVYALVPPSQLTVRGRYLAAVLACGARPPILVLPPYDARPSPVDGLPAPINGLPAPADGLPVNPAELPVRADVGPAEAVALGVRSAADLRGLRECHRRAIEVIVAGQNMRRHRGIEVHRSVHLDPARDITIIDGIPVTTVDRTLLDLAGVVGRRELERALDRAEQLRVFDLRGLEDQLRRNPGHPGAGRLAATLATHTAGETITDSELEERMYAVIRPTGIPRPEFRGPIDPGDGGVILRPDFVWYGARLAVEVDGRRSHLTRRAFEADRRRDQRLTVAGWRVIRVTWRQLTERPAEVVRLLCDLLAGSVAA